jgi:hypothetical protein
MDKIDVIAQRFRLEFNFLTSKGYFFEPMEYYNKDNEKMIFARMSLSNNILKRKITFAITPREEIRISVYINDMIMKQSLDLKDYIEFKKGTPPKYNPPFIIDDYNLEQSIHNLSANIRLLMETNLKDVVGNREWITFPTFDPRDDY